LTNFAIPKSLVKGWKANHMITLKNCWQMLSLAVLSLGLSAHCESKVSLARPADGTPQQPTPSTQVNKSTPGQIEIGPSSQTKSLGLTTEQVAVKPPQITYDDGQLTIVAENVPLSAVFDVLRRIMGVNIEMPPGAADQLIWVKSGPGPARRILRELLDGTEFDYIIQASESDVDGVRSVLLTARSKGGDTGESGGSPVRSLTHGAQPSSVPAADSSDVDIAPVESVSSSGEPATADSAAATSGQLPPTNVQLSSLGSKPSPGASAEGGSEQMIQQLQTLYQQRRQMQMQQNQKLPTAN
jgi:hypothetical protein